MFQWRSVFLVCCVFLLATGWGAQDESRDATMPDRAAGTFVQRKTLADVEVTITSKGTFRFEKGRFFEWNTLEPLPSTFVATPTNYALTVNGRTTTHRLRNDVTSIEKIFEIKEVKDFVKEVRSEPQTGFPERLTVDFKNGDRLAIQIKVDTSELKPCLTEVQLGPALN